MSRPFKNYPIFFLLITLLYIISFICPRQARAFDLIGDLVTLDVSNAGFSVVWEAQIEGTIGSYQVFVYTGSDESGPITYTPSYQAYSSNGIFAISVDLSTASGVDPEDIEPQDTVYYKVEVVEDGATYTYPAGSLMPVTLAQAIEVPADNGRMRFRVYSDETDPIPAEGAFVYAVVGEGSPYPADYPVADLASGGGWVAAGTAKANVDLGTGLVRRNNGADYNIAALIGFWGGDIPITVHCLGGDLGRKMDIAAMYDVNLAGSVGCFLPSSDCVDGFGIIRVLPNQGPDITFGTLGVEAIEVDAGNHIYAIYTNQAFTLKVQGSDIEGDSFTWSLDGEPSGMTIPADPADPTDPNKAQITWNTPADLGGQNLITYPITVNATDTEGSVGSESFTVRFTNGIPSPPDSVVITTTTPQTEDDLSCTITGGSDPLGDPITYNYRWYNDVNGTEDTGSTKDTVITLDDSLTAKGETWSCEVTVTDDAPDNDGTSGPTTSTGVEILNTPPDGTPVVTITSSDTTPPTTVSDLTAAVDISGCTDDDPVDDPLSYVGNKWWKKPYEGSFSETNISALTLSHNDTEKGETWIYKATVTDGHDTGNTGTSNELEIQNTRPDPPASVTINKVGSGIQCSVTPGADADGDTLQYKYDWVCDIGGDVDHSWMNPNTDLLTGVAANQTWYCEVTVRDTGFGALESSTFTRSATPDIFIDNTPPNWKSSVPNPLTISPDPAFNNQSLTCTVTSDAVEDNDGHDVLYTYQWYDDSGSMGDPYKDANTDSLTSMLNDLVQGATYYCEVKLWDGMDHDVGTHKTTSSVTIGNRNATIKVKRGNDEIGDGQTVQVTETEQLVLVITCDDADNNDLAFSEPNMPSAAYSDPNFDSDFVDPNYAEFTWTPAQGDAGTYEVVFKVEETYNSSTGQETQIITHSVQIKVIYPLKVIDNFEFQSEPDPDWYLPTNTEEDLEKRSDHGWSVLTGSGDIYRKSYENDPNDHYLNMVSNESDPLKYIPTLWLADPNETKDFYGLRCFIDTNSPYSVDAYVGAVDTVSGDKENYFLRYIPENPSQHSGNVFEVDEMRINYYIGSGFIDPNGCQLERNMDDDIHNAIAAKGKQYQSHYDYVLGFILRGDIDKFDNLEVVYGERDTVSPKPPQSGSAVGIDKAVVLTWTDPNQDDDVIGYEIAWQKDGVGQIYTPQKVYVWEEGISGAEKSCTIPFALNYSDGYYLFTIKAFDDAKEANYSSALELQATPHLDTIAPDMTECVLTAQAPETQGETINLAWTDPNAANLSYFKLYMDGSHIATLDKTVLTYQVTGLMNDTGYLFKLEGYNGDHLVGTYSPEVTGIPRAPKVLVFDDFEYVAQSQTPKQHGWQVLQGSGSIAAMYEDGNSCMRMTTSYSNKLNFIVTKFVDNPEDYTNTKLHFNLKGEVGQFKIDLYVSDSNGNKYFLSYSPNASYDDDDQKPDPCKTGMYITHYLGWDGNVGTVWHHVVRDLQKDLQDGVPGATFGSFLGMVIRGEVFIDDIIFKRALPEVDNLVAISDDAEVDLFWTRTDPNVDDFYLSVEEEGGVDVLVDVLIDDTTTPSLHIDGNQCSCEVDNLDNDTTYSFTIKQGNSSGVTVSATPHDFVFEEDCNDSGDWTDQGSTLGSYSIVVDPETHDNVLVIDPGDTAASSDLIRYYVGLTTGIHTTGSKVAVNIKSDEDFVLWFTVQDTSGVEYNLLYASGQGTGSAFGTWSFSYLPSCGDGDWTDGSWHTVDLELNDNLWLQEYRLQGYSAQVDEVTDVSIGGCDDVSVDNLSVY